MSQSFNPNPSTRELTISEILREAFGPDPSVPRETPMHYDVDASFLDMMLNASPSEEHLLDYLGAQQEGADHERIGQAVRQLLKLARAV